MIDHLRYSNDMTKLDVLEFKLQLQRKHISTLIYLCDQKKINSIKTAKDEIRRIRGKYFES